VASCGRRRCGRARTQRPEETLCGLSARSTFVGRSKIPTACDSGEYVGYSVEEEELGRHRGLDEHDDAGRDDCQEGDDVHHTDAIEDDVAWPSQRFG
jgi:hypothetical protein